ncbi:MAG TPA: choice-of-anchor Q domain-containing protein, partial [Blastocatellia bacterium]|nr:choice-of-anchor Q domain-containing protein [Blastocatellia bacterium]
VFGSGQNNIIQDTSSATFFPGFGDIIGASPLLLPLGNYGGPTPSMPPQPNSPAINAGAQAVLADLDQRGFLRRPTGSSDIGSVGTDYSFSLIGGTPQSANATKPFASPLQAKVTESGVPISGATVTFTAPSSGASALFGGSNTATVITDSNGLATSPTVIANGFAGSYTVTASIGSSFPAVSYDLTNIQVVSNIVASAGSPQHTALSAQFPVALQATVLDSNNGPVQGINVTFSAPTTGASGKFAGSVTSVTVATNSNGVATAPAFTANNIVGSYSVTASVDGNVQPGSFSLTNLPPTVSVKTGSPQSTAPGANFLIPLQALVLDGNGNPLSNVSVLFTAPSNGASGTFNGNGLSVSINTDSSGVATAPLFVANNSIGSYTVTASIAGNPTPASFSLNNVTPGQPATVTATQGQGQKAGLNIDYGPLQVTVADASGIPVGGITVTFQVDPGGSGATGSFTGNQNAATAITDVNGRATAPTLTANNIIGSFDVTASTSVQGSSSADFNLANIVVVSGDLSGDGQVTVQDLVILANIIAGNITSTPTQKVCGDVFQDNTGQITIQDLVTLANFIAGNIHSLPVVSGPIVNPAEKRGY